MKIIVFGTGKKYIQNKLRFQHMQIIAFLDNDKKKQGYYLDGVMIDAPCNIYNYQFDYVILLSKYYKEMRSQLLSLGVDKTKILDKEHKGKYSQIRESVHYDVVKTYSNTGKKRIAMIMHSMTIGGASIALVSMAKVLKRHSFDVQIYADWPGPILYDILKEEIPVTVLEGFELNERELEYYFSDYDLIIVNTILLHDFVSKMSSSEVPIIWWLHEEECGYRAYHVGKEDINIGSNTYIYGVGSRAMQTFLKYCPSADVHDLHYGITKKSLTENKKNNNNKVVFAVIGVVAYHKGQDILREAIRQSWNKWKKQAEFWMIGPISDEIRRQYEYENQIRIFGAVDHEEVLKLMEEIDIVICVSRYDTMPIVLAEAMMLNKVCITTDVTGTADYIVPYKNGLVCKADDVMSLSEQIDWVLTNKGQLKSIGEEAYKVYEKEFSEEIFEEKVIKIVNGIVFGNRNEEYDTA